MDPRACRPGPEAERGGSRLRRLPERVPARPSLYVDQDLERGLAARVLDGGEAIGQPIASRDERHDIDFAGSERGERAIERTAPRSHDRHFIYDDRRPRHCLLACDRRLEDDRASWTN